MYTDKCEIVNRTFNSQFGDTIDGAPLVVSCRVEDEDKVVSGTNGNESVHKRLYFLPPSTTIKKGDKIKVTEMRGVPITEDHQIVDSVFPVGGFSPHHLEVSCFV